MSEPESPPSPSPAPRSRGGIAGMILQYTRGLILDQHLRRQTMFYTVLAAMLMAFAGDVIFGDWHTPDWCGSWSGGWPAAG